MTEIARHTLTPGSPHSDPASFERSSSAVRRDGKSGANGSGLVFKQATEPWEFEEIHQLNYASFVEEVPQHPANDDRLLVDQFDSEHEQLFTFKLGEGHEILMIRAVVKARAAPIADFLVGEKGTTLEDCVIHDSRYYYDGEWHDVNIYDRGKLHEGLLIPGPAIVIEMDSTTVVLPDHEARVDAIGNLLINPRT